MVINIKVKTHEEWGWTTDLIIPLWVLKRAWAEIDVEAIDVADFSVTVRISPGRLAEFEGEGHEWFKAELDLYLWEVAGKYKVKIEMVDISGNELDPAYEVEIDGWFGGVLRFFEDLWEFICAVVSAIADAVMAALSFLFELIARLFAEAIKALMDGIVSLLRPVIEDFIGALLGVAKGNDLNDLQNPIVLASLFAIGLTSVKRTRDLFQVGEAVEGSITVLLMATGVGGAAAGAAQFSLGKVILEVVNVALKTIFLPMAVMTAASAFADLVNNEDLSTELAKHVDEDAVAIIGVILGVVALMLSVLKKGVGQTRSKFATSVAWAVVALAWQVAGVALLASGGFDHGLPLFIVDAFSIAFATIGLTTFVGKYIFKDPTNDGLTFFGKTFAKIWTLIETALTWICGTTAIVAAFAHGADGRYQE